MALLEIFVVKIHSYSIYWCNLCTYIQPMVLSEREYWWFCEIYEVSYIIIVNINIIGYAMTGLRFAQNGIAILQYTCLSLVSTMYMLRSMQK